MQLIQTSLNRTRVRSDALDYGWESNFKVSQEFSIAGKSRMVAANFSSPESCRSRTTLDGRYASLVITAISCRWPRADFRHLNESFVPLWRQEDRP